MLKRQCGRLLLTASTIHSILSSWAVGRGVSVFFLRAMGW